MVGGINYPLSLRERVRVRVKSPPTRLTQAQCDVILGRPTDSCVSLGIMTPTRKALAILGSTGSVGTQTLDVVRMFPDQFNVLGISCNRNLELLSDQIREFTPELVSSNATESEKSDLPRTGWRDCTLSELATHGDVDVVVTATVGDIAIGPTLGAIEAGKQIALANKETLVMAGELVTRLASENDVKILPLDSEPNAIWQCIRGEASAPAKLIITASGGAFRNTPISELSSVTPQQALQHPTWQMGRKITVDSATLMNKAFEVIEAHWLFGVPWEDIEIVVHPQSIVHSMVEFADGSVKAQLSTPDMRLPIQYALAYPDRLPNPNIPRFLPAKTRELTFSEYDPDRYPCFEMAIEFARRGGTWPAFLSRANDAAVEAFLDSRIGFLEIADLIRDALASHSPVSDPDLRDILAAGKDGFETVNDLAGA